LREERITPLSALGASSRGRFNVPRAQMDSDEVNEDTVEREREVGDY